MFWGWFNGVDEYRRTFLDYDGYACTDKYDRLLKWSLVGNETENWMDSFQSYLTQLTTYL